MSVAQEPIGTMLREWRTRRRLSQLDLALDTEISTKHLSFVETGRAQPSREMILRLAEQLEIPLREQNLLLLAGGYAPVYGEHELVAAQMAQAMNAIDRILTGHEPYPAIAIDRYWRLKATNQAIGPLLQGVAPFLLETPVNVLRVSLHPEGLAPRIVNLPEWRAHLLQRLDRQIAHSGDPILIDLRAELASYPVLVAAEPVTIDALLVPLVLRTPVGELQFFSTTTVFGTPLDITLSELAIEAFFPANAETAELLHAMSQATSA